MSTLDCIYISAATSEARYTRICVASIRYFYPKIPIRLLVSGRLQRGLVDELRQYWDVGIADLPRGEYGWGFAHWEPLFGPPGERFLMLDSDTVITGPVLDLWNDDLLGEDEPSKGRAPFLVDDEKQSEADTKGLYYDWEKVRQIDPSAQAPQFVFNAGQWFGTAGVLTREDFAPWVEWTMPRRVRYPTVFMPGDQGVLNYVFNKKVLLGDLRVERRKIMRWPGHSMEGLDAERVVRHAAEPLIVHWAGVKKARQRDMIGAELLVHFEKVYYQRIPSSEGRRLFAGCSGTLSHWLLGAQLRVKLALRKIAARRKAAASGGQAA